MLKSRQCYLTENRKLNKLNKNNFGLVSSSGQRRLLKSSANSFHQSNGSTDWFLNENAIQMSAILLIKTYATSLSIYKLILHYNDVIMSAITSQITSVTIVYSNVYSDADQRKHQGSASLVFVRGIHRGPVNSPHKGPVTRKMFPFNDVIMNIHALLHPIVVWKRSISPTSFRDTSLTTGKKVIMQSQGSGLEE